jgi:hypothetical protein
MADASMRFALRSFPMTFDRIADGLQELVQRLATNQETATPPATWQPWEWAYVLGIASGAVMRVETAIRARPVPFPYAGGS